jgi:predicted DNA-binding protein (MmcQ/YjbR family)
MASNMARIAKIVWRLPETERVDVEAWGDEPTFRVRGKTFIFASPEAGTISVKLPIDEAEATVASDQQVTPTGYGLGRHGWVTITIPDATTSSRWQEIEEWIRTSYIQVAPKRLGRVVLEEDSNRAARNP